MRGKILSLLGALLLSGAPAAAQVACGDSGVVLQVLGSGGPVGVGRASAGYLLWIDGVGRIMVDAGGGTFTRFHEAGAQVGDLDLLALSHFHPDHSSEVPALLWVQPTSLTVSGPSGNAGYPSVGEYVTGLFGREGVFRTVTDGGGLETVTVDVTGPEATEVFRDGTIRVRGLGVPHANVPAVGYRIDVGDASIAFSSDQNGSDPAFAEFASGVDILVAHVSVSETASGFVSELHAKPSVWGEMATNAGAGTLVLSHLTRIAPRDPQNPEAELPGLSERLSNVRSRYSGSIVVAEDLMCIPIGSGG
jgi:ribonuclease BN (tRNA processing enzyme)